MAIPETVPDPRDDIHAKVAFLVDRATLDGEHDPAPTRVIETHLSWVFITAERVYKLKKPVRYPFVDLATLDARLHNCREELRLNRELAPDVYLGLTTLFWCHACGFNLDGDGELVDVLIRMRRLPDILCLENQLRAGTVQPAEVTRAADRLVGFYQHQPPLPPADPADIGARLDADADELRGLLRSHTQLCTLVSALHDGLNRYGGALGRRPRLEAHGDLRPQHVYLGPDPVFIDRLEFSRALRVMDPVEELAYLHLECTRLGGEWVGRSFLEHYQAYSGDRIPSALLAFYHARRALLWALLAARHVERGGDREHWIGISHDYVRHGLAAIGSANQTPGAR